MKPSAFAPSPFKTKAAQAKKDRDDRLIQVGLVMAITKSHRAGLSDAQIIEAIMVAWQSVGTGRLRIKVIP